jgi:hypothetical protein
MIDDNVRKLIREVLAEELRRVKSDAKAAPGGHEETVSLTSDADLSAFVAKLMKLAGDAKARRDIEQGRLVFRLASKDEPALTPTTAPASTGAGDTVRIERGMVSERQVDALPGGTKVLQAGKAVIFTPLARDRLRQRGIKMERTG